MALPWHYTITPLPGEINHVRVYFSGGFVFTTKIPTPKRWRGKDASKGKVAGAEIDRYLELKDHFVIRVGHGHFLHEYKGKWIERAIERQTRPHLYKKRETLDDDRNRAVDARHQRWLNIAKKLKKSRPDLTYKQIAQQIVERKDPDEPGTVDWVKRFLGRHLPEN